MRGVGLERQVAELVDDQQLGLGEEARAAPRAGPRRAPWRARRPAPSPGRTAPSSPARIASRPSATARCVLPTPGGPSSSSASPLATQRPVASSRICFGSSEGWASKSKPSRSRDEREVGDRHRHLDPPLVLAGDLALAQEGERLAQRQLAPGRLVEQAVELVADRGQLAAGRASADERVVARRSSPASPDRLLVLGERPQQLAAGAPAAPPRRGRGSPAGRRQPATPSKWAGSTTPLRAGRARSACAATSRRHGGRAPSRRRRSTRTRSPISRQGTL